MNRKVPLIFVMLYIASAFFIFSNDRGSPIEVIRSANTDIRNLYSKNSFSKDEVKKKIKNIVEGITDFSLISRRVTGRFCARLSKNKCTEFQEVFREFIMASILKKTVRIRKTKVTYIEENVEKDRSVVKTVIYRKGKTVSTNYQLEHIDGKWKIVNYIVDDIDSIKNYIDQFEKLFNKKTFEEIILKLRKRTEKYNK